MAKTARKQPCREPEENGSGSYESDFESDEDEFSLRGKERFRWNENRQKAVTDERLDKAMKMDREQDRQSTRYISKPALKKPNRLTKRSQLIPTRLPMQPPSVTPQPPATRYPVDSMHAVDERSARRRLADRIVERQSAAKDSAAEKMPANHSDLIESSLNPPSSTKLTAPVPPPPRQQPTNRRPKLVNLRKIEVTEDVNLKSPRAKSPKTNLVPRPPAELCPQSHKRRPNLGRLRPIELIKEVNLNTHYSSCKVEKSLRPTAVPQPPCEIVECPRAQKVPRTPFITQCDVANMVPKPPMEPRPQSHKRRPKLDRLRKTEVTENINSENSFSPSKVDTQKSSKATAVPQPPCVVSESLTEDVNLKSPRAKSPKTSLGQRPQCTGVNTVSHCPFIIPRRPVTPRPGNNTKAEANRARLQALRAQRIRDSLRQTE